MQKLISRLSFLWKKADKQEECTPTKGRKDDATSAPASLQQQKDQKSPPPSSSSLLPTDRKTSSNYLPILDPKNRLDLIPNIVDKHAAQNPEKVFASIPVDNSDLSQGFRDITYLEFRRAVDKAAYWLEQHLGTPPRDDQQEGDGSSASRFPTFAFYGTRDLRYSIFAVAAMKAGFKMLSPSLLCTMDAHVYLVKESNCHDFFCIPSTLPLAEEIITKIQQSQLASSYRMSTATVPELLELLPIDKTQNVGDIYTYSKSWDEACDHPCLIVHTSGSTGMPKIVYYTMRMLANPMCTGLLPPVNGQPPLMHSWSGRVFTTVPPFHLLGYAGFLICPIYFDVVGVMAPPDRPVDADLADEIHRYARLDGGMYHPSLLQDLVRDEHKRQELGKLKTIFYSGSPLETTTGDWLASTFGTLANILGSTEGFSWPNARVIDPVKDWSYIHFYPMNGLHFQPVGLAREKKDNNNDDDDDNELYELVVYRTPETEAFTNIFLSRPHLSRWPTKDLWKPHPDPAKSGHWLYRGRTDDLVVLSGEIKMYAADLEDKVCSAHHLIRTALIGGNQRKQPFLLLELAAATDCDETAALDEIWSHLSAINTRYAHGSVRLSRSLVLVADKSRPFVRLAKGSLARNQTFALYKQDIDNLYAEMDRSSPPPSSPSVDQA